MSYLLCNTQVVRNLLAGIQSQDRRPIKLPAGRHFVKAGNKVYIEDVQGRVYSELGNLNHPHQVGDVLYCRETMVCERELPERLYFDVLFSADRTYYEPYGGNDDETEWFMQYKQWWSRGDDKVVIPSIHMPKWAARIFLKVTAVGVERIQDISEADAKAEGVRLKLSKRPQPSLLAKKEKYITAFQKLWNSLYPGSWERNDYVWKTTFKLIERPEK